MDRGGGAGTGRLGGVAVRTIFLLILTALTVRVASPQTEKIWSLFETPGDFIRVALGLAVCVWLVVNLFILPKDAGAYRIWMYLGLLLLCLLVVAFVPAISTALPRAFGY